MESQVDWPMTHECSLQNVGRLHSSKIKKFCGVLSFWIFYFRCFEKLLICKNNERVAGFSMVSVGNFITWHILASKFSRFFLVGLVNIVKRFLCSVWLCVYIYVKLWQSTLPVLVGMDKIFQSKPIIRKTLCSNHWWAQQVLSSSLMHLPLQCTIFSNFGFLCKSNHIFIRQWIAFPAQIWRLFSFYSPLAGYWISALRVGLFFNLPWILSSVTPFFTLSGKWPC